jgi:N-acetylmuramoyl-L-alanine amidase
VPEFAFNTAAARQLAEALRTRRIAAFLVGGDDDASLEGRSAAAARGGADLFVSIHHDSVQPRYLEAWTPDGKTLRYSDRFSGYSVFYSERNAQATESRVLATRVGAELAATGFHPSPHHAEHIPGEGRELVDPARGVYRFDDLVVLRTAPMAAILVELGIIVNRDEERQLTDPAVHARLADSIAAGIADVCGRTAPSVPPRSTLHPRPSVEAR